MHFILARLLPEIWLFYHPYDLKINNQFYAKTIIEMQTNECARTLLYVFNQSVGGFASGIFTKIIIMHTHAIHAFDQHMRCRFFYK